MAESYRPDSPAELDAKLERFVSNVRVASLSAADHFSASITDLLKENLSEPYPPPSSAMEDPHLRTGALQAGISGNIITTADGVELAIVSERQGDNPKVPMELEFGNPGGNLGPRMYMTRSLEYWSVQMDTLTAILSDRLQDVSR